MRVTVTVGTNIASLLARRYVATASDRLSRSLERLASGQRINRASDDAAGLAISSTLRSNARVYSQGLRNISDAQSALSISQGSLEGLSDIVIRLRELSTQSANGTFSLSQRRSNDAEADALVTEFNRTVATASFNGLNLLGASFGTMRIQAGFGTDGGIAIGLNDALSRNKGMGTYSSAITTTPSTAAQTNLVTADLNGDGILDAVSKTSLGGITSYIGNGDGTFSENTITSAGTASGDIYADDFNGDGKQDIVVAGGSGNVYFLQGLGNGDFRTATVIGMSTGPISNFAYGDVNADGKLDLVAYSGTTSGINTRLGNGDGTFAAAVLSGSGFSAGSTKLGDLNGDGKLDLVANAGTGFRTMIGDGTGQFYDPVTVAIASHSDFEIADFNGDGIKDIVTRGSTSANVLMGNGDRTFAAPVSYTTASSLGIQVGDMNNDGVLDIMSVGSGGASLLVGNSDGTFQGAVTKSLAGSSRGLSLSDVNGDGVLDFLTMRSGSLDAYLASAERTTTLQNINLCSQQDARSTMTLLDSLLERISRELGNIGSFQSRLQSAFGAVTANQENSLAAAGRIQDADVSSEAAEATRQTILQQAATGVLAQANQQSSIALQLLSIR